MTTRLQALRLLPLLALVACAHAPVQPIVISMHLLDGAGATFETVTIGMQAASQADALTAAQAVAWNDFTVRWADGYGKAVDAWREAKKRLDQPAAEQAAAMLTGLLAELGTFQIVVMGARQ